jgi:hypothetical protein
MNAELAVIRVELQHAGNLYQPIYTDGIGFSIGAAAFENPPA